MVLIINPSAASVTSAQKIVLPWVADTIDIPANTLVYKSAAGKVKAASSAAEITASVIGITTALIVGEASGNVHMYGLYQNGVWAFTGTSNARLFLEEGTTDLSETAPTTKGQWWNSPGFIVSSDEAFFDTRTDLVTEVI